MVWLYACLGFPVDSQCFIPSHHRWFSLPTSSQRNPGSRNEQTMIFKVWKRRPGTSLTGELMKTSVPRWDASLPQK